MHPLVCMRRRLLWRGRRVGTAAGWRRGGGSASAAADADEYDEAKPAARRRPLPAAVTDA